MGAIAIGVIIGFVLSWIINQVLHDVMWDRADKSREQAHKVELRRLERENERLQKKYDRLLEEM